MDKALLELEGEAASKDYAVQATQAVRELLPQQPSVLFFVWIDDGGVGITYNADADVKKEALEELFSRLSQTVDEFMTGKFDGESQD
jgi:hypothetical protein